VPRNRNSPRRKWWWWLNSPESLETTGMHDAMQDGLILFEEYLQSSTDTRIADQLQAGEASDKLLYAAELWQAAADMAALEG